MTDTPGVSPITWANCLCFGQTQPPRGASHDYLTPHSRISRISLILRARYYDNPYRLGAGAQPRVAAATGAAGGPAAAVAPNSAVRGDGVRLPKAATALFGARSPAVCLMRPCLLSFRRRIVLLQRSAAAGHQTFFLAEAR